MTTGSGLFINAGETDIGKIVKAIQQLMEGRSNATGSFTLGANTTVTTVASVTASPQSIVSWMPTSANGASQMATLRCTAKAAGSFTLTHASNANTDQTFDYVVIG